MFFKIRPLFHYPRLPMSPPQRDRKYVLYLILTMLNLTTFHTTIR